MISLCLFVFENFLRPEGFFSPHALDTWKPGTKLVLSGPLGYAYHMPVRDADHVIALAGSSGITPFFSMASAVADGIEAR